MHCSVPSLRALLVTPARPAPHLDSHACHYFANSSLSHLRYTCRFTLHSFRILVVEVLLIELVDPGPRTAPLSGLSTFHVPVNACITATPCLTSVLQRLLSQYIYFHTRHHILGSRPPPLESPTTYFLRQAIRKLNRSKRTNGPGLPTHFQPQIAAERILRSLWPC